MEKIKELPDIRENIDEYYEYHGIELLDYVCEVANWLLPNIHQPNMQESVAPAIFANRYFESMLNIEERYERHKMFYAYRGTLEEYQKSHTPYRKLNTSFKEKFLENEALQNTIEAFGFDVSKFWYLLLFVHDYIEDIGTNAPKLGKTVKEDVADFTAKLSEATHITLKKDNRKSYSTDCEQTINFFRNILQFYADNAQLLPQLFPNTNTTFDLTGNYLDISYKKWKFAEIFLHFLKDKTAKNLPNKKIKVSKDKMIFISRLIYTVGYDTKRYNEEYDSKDNKNRMLSSLLRRYQSQDFPDVMGRYYAM